MDNQVVVQKHQFKEVDFQGDSLLAINQLDKTYVGVSYVCHALGLSEGQMKAQRKKIQEDAVLVQGGRNFILPTNGGNQTVYCIELDFLPLWLAKISVTPTMKRENPDLSTKLVEYQLKAKDVLAQAFVRPKTSAELLLAQAELLVQAERRMVEMERIQYLQQEAISQQEQKLTAVIEVFSETPLRSRINRKVTEMARHQNISIQEAWHDIYAVIYDKYGIDLKRRIQNKRTRINQERVADGKRPYADSTLKQKVNALDIVMDEEMGKEVLEVVAGKIVS